MKILKYRYYILVAVVGSILASGCSSKNTSLPNPDKDLKKQIDNNGYGEFYNKRLVKKIMPYQQKVSLMVGSRSNDSKVIVNAGKVLKIFVTSYKKGSTLIAGHDIYTYVEKPGFIVGNSVPPRATDSITTPSSDLPFVINKRELNVLTSERELSNKDVKNFNNNLFQKRYGYTKNIKKITKMEKERDAALLNYIKTKQAKNGDK